MQLRYLVGILMISLLGLMSLTSKETPLLPAQGWHTKGNQIIDPQGSPVTLKSVSWFGFETSNYVVHGLWSRSLTDMLDQIKSLGFNSLRIPYSNQILNPQTQPNSINYHLNPDLQNKNSLAILDFLIDEAAKRNLYIILDRHRPTSAQQSELWYTAEVPEKKWINDWVFLAKRYLNKPNVIAFDLHNEPHGAATWGSGVRETDWRAAAKRAGNAILAANPNVLIIVEGIQFGVAKDVYWWGGALDGVLMYPVHLNTAHKVVYSPHDYGPGVYMQPWFNDPNFPNNLDEIWDAKWGYIAKQNIAPIWIGEFGGRATDLQSKEGIWQNYLVKYIHDHNLNFAYWSWNPNSGDTGGILNDDWTTVNQNKVEMLKPILQQ